MATTLLDTSQDIGSINGLSETYKFYYTATLDSQSVANNTSTITFKFGIGRGKTYAYNYSGWDASNPGVTLYWSSDNSTWNSLGFTVIGSTSTTEVTYVSKTATITHNANGTKAIYLRAEYTHGTANAYYMPNNTTYTSSALTLTTIARASSLTLAGSYTIGSTSASTYLTYTITPQASFYHKVVWSIGNNSVTLNKTTAISSATTYSDISNALMLPKFSTQTAKIRVTLYTYSDSGLTKQIGDAVYKDCSLSVNVSAVKPSISVATPARNSGPLTMMIAGYSTAKATCTVTNAPGATTASVTWSISQGSIASSNTSQAVSNTLPANTSNYNITFTATVKDSRGGTATATSANGTVYGYSAPSFTLTAYRCVSTSDHTEDSAGAAAYYSRSAVSWKSGLSGNTLTCSFKRGSTSITTAATASSGAVALATGSSLVFTATAYDSVIGSSNAITKTVTVSVAAFPLDLYQSGSTVGVGLGAVASANLVDSGLPIRSKSTGSTWLVGQNTVGRAALTVSDADTTNSFYPWIQHRNTATGKMFALGQIGTSVYLIGSATSRTANSYDSGIYFDLSDGKLHGTITYADSAGTASSCSGNAATATTASSCSGNAATATTASSCSGNAATATKLNGTNAGSAKQPVYFSSGVPTACRAPASLLSESFSSGSKSLSNAFNYNYIIVMGIPGGTGYTTKLSVTIPTALITTTASRWGLANEQVGLAFNLTKDGNNITIAIAAGTGSITNVYGGI